MSLSLKYFKRVLRGSSNLGDLSLYLTEVGC